MSQRTRLYLGALLFPLIAPVAVLCFLLSALWADFMFKGAPPGAGVWLSAVLFNIGAGLWSFIHAYFAYLRTARQLLEYPKLPFGLVVQVLNRGAPCYKIAFKMAVWFAGRGADLEIERRARQRSQRSNP